MKIEAKLALNNMRKNKKRTLYTTISLILCTTLILTTIILISSIRDGVSANFDTEYNDYHIILKDLSAQRFNKIKNKTYIDKIYIQRNEDAPLEKVDSSFTLQDNVTVYLKYKNIKNVCKNTNDIIASLELSEIEARYLYKICSFNQQLLTVHGFIDVTPNINNQGVPECRMRLNYSYAIDLMIIVTIIAFSAFFIIILYNAFLITINERKKEYAILNSVGGTEGQILKMVFTEAIFMGIIGVAIGLGLALLIANIILGSLNNILNTAGYYFKLVIDVTYIALSIFLIVINLYLSVLIPSLKASSTSVIQGIRNNKQIKYKRKNTVLEKILPIEGKVAIKNIKRNKSKYRLIIILLVIAITSFIAMSTYLEYEKETADLVTEYDVDAEMSLLPNDDYRTILKGYEEKYDKEIDIIEYRKIDNEYYLVEPSEAIVNDNLVVTHTDNTKSIYMTLVALNEETYNQYIKKVNANYGDFIIYNVMQVNTLKEDEETYNYIPVLKENSNLKIKLVTFHGVPQNKRTDYEIIEEKILNGNYVLTDKIVEGFKEVRMENHATLFMNMETFNRLDNYIEKTYGKVHSDEGNEKPRRFWDNRNDLYVKIKCDNIIELENYMDEVKKKQNTEEIFIQYYTLENQEKLLYIDIVELILKVVMIAIISIGIISTINIMNASLCERKEDFNILYRLGATKGNVKKILMYEGTYMFIKATIISIILSIPIIYKIIKHMENIIALNKILIPFGNISIFIAIMFVIYLIITIYSTKMIKEE